MNDEITERLNSLEGKVQALERISYHQSIALVQPWIERLRFDDQMKILADTRELSIHSPIIASVFSALPSSKIQACLYLKRSIPQYP